MLPFLSAILSTHCPQATPLTPINMIPARCRPITHFSGHIVPRQYNTYLHACPPLGYSSQKSRELPPHPPTLLCQASSSPHHRAVLPPKMLNSLLPNSAVPTKPIISHGVWGSFHPSKQTRSLWPTGPFAPSALALLWFPLAQLL